MFFTKRYVLFFLHLFGFFTTICFFYYVVSEKSLSKKVKVESEKVGLKLNTQKTKIMASDPIASWQIDGKTVERVEGFIFEGAAKSLQMFTVVMKKKKTLLGRKIMTNLDSILKSRDITLPTKSI